MMIRRVPPYRQEDLTPSPPTCSGHRLFAAILTTAVHDLLAPTAGRCAQRREAEALCAEARAWIAGAPAPMSFDDCCTALGFDVEATRKALLDDADPTRVVVLFEIGARSAA